MRILVIQHDDDKGLGLLDEPLRAAGATLDVCHAGREWPALDDHAAVIALPGLADPPDATPAIEGTRHVLAEALRRGLPVLGLCLGAELLAEAAGGRTRRCTPEYGFAPVHLLPAAGGDALLGGLPQTFDAFHAHGYEIDLPPGAVPLAVSAVCTQAFRVGTCAWGMQFHPEAAVELIEVWLPTVRQQLDAAAVDLEATVRRARAVVPDWVPHATAIAAGFAAACACRA
jgi:GMP synthase-like glutamine amidotransferase